MYRYKLYIAVKYTVMIQTSLSLKKRRKKRRKKWSENPKGKTQATFLTVYTKLVAVGVIWKAIFWTTPGFLDRKK